MKFEFETSKNVGDIEKLKIWKTAAFSGNDFKILKKWAKTILEYLRLFSLSEEKKGTKRTLSVFDILLFYKVLPVGCYS